MKDGGPAFPCGERYITTDLAGNKTEHSKSALKSGMSLRDHFAGLAMQTTLDTARADDRTGISFEDHIASISYKIADAMLKERDKPCA